MSLMRTATRADTAAIRDLLKRCAAADGHDALSEFKELRVPQAAGTQTLVADAANGAVEAVGVAAWHPADGTGGYWAAEIALDPAVRSVDRYAATIDGMEATLNRPLALWTFNAIETEAAAGRQMTESRVILEMRRPLPTPPARLPEELELRSFVVGDDETTWLGLNRRVFANHPEAGAIDAADLALRMAQPWFDPKGFLLLTAAAEPVGYCWTKLHPGAVGEIYMIGLVPQWRGRGLARQLTLAGLEYLADRGATTGMLYAEAANAAAVGMYESMGFAPKRRIALYEASGAP